MSRYHKLFEKIAAFEKLATMSPEEAANLLGVSPDASVEEVNKAHKKMVFQFHPDRNQSPGSTEKMVAINVARDVLTNPTAHIQQEGPAARPEVQQEIEDVLDREQRKADEWIADIRKRREWSDYLGMQIPVEELTHPENIENAKTIEARRAQLREKAERAKQRKQEKKKGINKAIGPDETEEEIEADIQRRFGNLSEAQLRKMILAAEERQHKQLLKWLEAGELSHWGPEQLKEIEARKTLHGASMLVLENVGGELPWKVSINNKLLARGRTPKEALMNGAAVYLS